MLEPTFVPARKTSYRVTPTLSVEAFHATVALVAVADVTLGLPGWDGATVSGAGLGVLVPMVAVTVFVASRVPVSVRARTWKVWLPLLALGEPVAKVSPNGALISESTCLPSIRNSILPGSSSVPSRF